MSRDPLSVTSPARTPQRLPLPGRTDMVRNAAGGYVFAKPLFTRLEDFLILGTAGGTYYVDERQQTYDNIIVVTDALAADGVRAVQLAVDVSTGKPPRAPRNNPALYLLAAALTMGDLETRRAASAALQRVARTTFHQAQFFGYWKSLHGKPNNRGGVSPRTGRLTRTALSGLLLGPDPDQAAFRACKAMARKTPSGEDFSLRDVLRIAHPKPDSPEREALFGWITGAVPDKQARALLPSVDAFLTAKAVTSSREAVRVVGKLGVPWEFLPDAVLRDPEVWAALAETIGMTALLRNLARMTRLGTLKPLTKTTRRVTERLTDERALAEARIHPLDVYLALRVYGSGLSHPHPRVPPQQWTPVPAVCDALEEAFDRSFGHVERTGRRLLIAVDTSLSMNMNRATASGSVLGTAYQVANAMAAILVRTEGPDAHVIEVDFAVRPSKLTARTRLREIHSWSPAGGGTNLALPFTYAREQRMHADAVVVLTDNETWSGNAHPSQELEEYRQAVNPQARCIVVALTPNGGTIGDPTDEGVLNVAGFDASLPQVVRAFLRER